MRNIYCDPPSATFKQPDDVSYEPSPSEFKVRGTPLFELLSLRLGNNSMVVDGNGDVDVNSAPPVELYGRIVLVDEHQNEFTVFHRNQHEAKTVFLSDPSSTSVLNGFDIEGPRCLSGKFWLQFWLRDRYKGILLLDDSLFVDCTRGVIYDKIQSFQFATSSMSIWVDYKIHLCALIANVGVVVDKVESDPQHYFGSNADVSGSIIATTQASDMNNITEIVLYDGSEKLVFGALNKLSTFAVSCFSLLKIEVGVTIDGDQIISSHKFRPNDWFSMPYESEASGNNYRIRVIVKWNHPSKFLPEYSISEYFYDDSIKVSNKRPRNKHVENGELIYIQPHLRSLSNQNWDVSVGNRVPCMEIYSISICSYSGDDSPLYLNGKISAFDEDNNYVIFDRVLEYDTSHSNGTLRLVGPSRCCAGDYVGMKLDLKDIQGREMSRGCVVYDYSTIDRFLNMRLCSIIRGKHGFAAVHYTIFSDAIEAKLGFTLKPITPDVSLKFHGRIRTRYNNFRYSTHHQKKYYQSTVFEKSESETVDFGELPLSQSVVAVPLNASLVVLAKIHVVLDGDRIETLQYEQKFDPPSPKRRMSIIRPCATSLDAFKCQNFHFEVSVKWVRVGF